MKHLNVLSVALFSLFVGCVNAKSYQSSPTDIGVVNKERILYWLEKRGELDQQQDKEAAIARFIGKPTPSHASRQQKYITPDFSKLKYVNKSSVSSLTANSNETKVKVLVILVDFPDLPYNDNRLEKGDTAMYYSLYDQPHYQQMLFSTSGYEGPSGQTLNSAYQFYQQASGNTLSFTGEVFGWVRADKNAKAYGERVGDDADSNAPSLVKEAVEKAVNQFDIDLSQFDLTDLDDIDGDGITNEPNGIIDHVMIFHSSVGEEAGGGVLGADAIWSHRFYVYNEQFQPSDLPNSPIDLFGYTINPLDAGIGVVVHEFGHDLGLPDEYDLNNSEVGEPVASWSVMSGGSWAGNPRGSEPVMFSPYALEYLQNRYSGNWLNQLTFDLNELNAQTNQILHHTSAVTGDLNQIKVVLPAKLKSFFAAVEGKFQYYSGSGNNLVSTMTRSVSIPDSSEQTLLELSAFYSIETDYDYAQVRVNGEAISSQYTKTNNPYYTNLGPYITGDSLSNGESKLPNNHLIHQFDMSAYAGQTVTLEFRYVTDTYVNYTGIVIDDLKLIQQEQLVWQDNAEQKTQFELGGFSRVGAYTYDTPKHYYLQLRSYAGIDSGLQKEQYSPGLLLWLASTDFANNNTSEHPGEGFILVVDADQNMITRGISQGPANTEIQLRDAAFSVYEQRQGLGDNNLTAISKFNDTTDYSFAIQPQSGVKLAPFGFGFSIADQAVDNSSVEVDLSYESKLGITSSINDLSVVFEVNGLQLSPTDSFEWQFGNGEKSNELSPTANYAEYGRYLVTFSRVKESGEKTIESHEIMLTEPLSFNEFEVSANESSLTGFVTASGGLAPYTYQWEFGDGNSSSSDTVKHNYNFSGSYAIKVTVTDSADQMLTSTKNVSVSVPLSVSANYTATNLLAAFNAQATGGFGDYSYSWEFGDGATSTSEFPQYTYKNAGSYQVILIVTDVRTNLSVSKTLAVTVQQKKVSSGGSLYSWILLCGFMLAGRRIYKKY